MVFGESRDLNEHMNHHNQVPENDQIILHKVLRILAAQQEVIIGKLHKIENVLDRDLPDIKSQHEALRIEVSEALKVSLEQNNAGVEKKNDYTETYAQAASSKTNSPKPSGVSADARGP